MNFENLLAQLGQGGGRRQNIDGPLNDTSEQIQISSLALLKMLKHGFFSSKGWSTYGSNGINAWIIYR